MRITPTHTYKPVNSRTKDYITTTTHTTNLQIYGTCTGKVLIHSGSTWYEYTSHVQAFDYLESMEIAESVCAMEVYDRGNGRMMVVSANERSIRVDDVGVGECDEIMMKGIGCKDEDDESVSYKDCNGNDGSNGYSINTPINAPTITNANTITNINASTITNASTLITTPTTNPTINPPTTPTTITTINPTVINTSVISELDAHSYNIHSLSIRNHFLLSSDYFCIDLHNIYRMKDSVLNLINIKPANLDNLGSVITKCTYFSFDTFLYALSSGKIYLNDMRVCIQSRRTHQFSYQPDNYKEILSAVSDISVVDDHSFVARNLNTVILYDTRNDRSCVSTYEVFKADAKSVQRVCNLELVYERMHCVYEDGRIVTGDFDGNFYVFGRDGERVSVKGEGVAKVIGCRENEIVVCGESICYYKVE